MLAIVTVVLILASLGGLGFAAHVLWLVLISALILWVIGFPVGTIADGVESAAGRSRRRRWYGR